MMGQRIRVCLHDFLRDHYGKMFIIFGICFLVSGLLSLVTVSEEYPWSCGISFLFGITLTGVGFLLELEFYSDSGLIGRLGAVFVTVSLICFAGVLMVISYRVVVGSKTVPVIFHGQIVGWTTRLITNLPYGWLALPLFVGGLCLLVVGAALKLYSEVA